MSKFSHYKTALYLSVAIAVGDIFFLLFIDQNRPDLLNRFAGKLIFALVVVLGLWVQSNWVRYVGAVGMVIWAGAIVWGSLSLKMALVTSQLTYFIPAFLYFAFAGVLNLLTAGILLFSKKFAKGFADQRDAQPKYKTILRRSLLAVIVLGMIVATFNDIVNLANGP